MEQSSISYFDFFDGVRSLLSERDCPIRQFKSKLRKLLNLVCDDELKDSKENYGSMFFRIDYLCRKYNSPSGEKYGLQSVRFHTGRNSKSDSSILLDDIRTLTEFYCRIHELEIPDDILLKLPEHKEKLKKNKTSNFSKKISCVRAIVQSVLDLKVVVSLNLEQYNSLYKLDISSDSLQYLGKMLKEGSLLNLIDASFDKDGNVIPLYIVYEPDFLVDISSIAQCFADYGHHPLSFIVNKMRRKPLSQPILLGNFAGSSLDDIIHSSEGDYKVNDTIRNNFKEKSIDFCTCPNFNADLFVKNAKDQASNIEQAVTDLFSQFDKDKALLEPTFICETLGIQGRVDLMTIDFNLLIEQKSGKNGKLEWQKDAHDRMMPDTHYVQLLLYLGIMVYNFGKKAKDVNVKLLYSRYAPNLGLINVGFEHKTFLETLKVRNQIVATEFSIAQNGIDRFLDFITPNVINQKHLNSDFYLRYLLPQIMEVTAPLQGMNAIEKAYFCNFANFAYKELLIGKVGRSEEKQNCSADLWNLTTEKKKESGNIYVGLRILSKKESSTFNGFDTITLQVPDQGDDFLPNFRVGDMVFLYSYNENEEPDVRKSILFSGYLTRISTEELEVRLGDGQKNPNLIDYYSPLFALEHASSDASVNSELRGLLEFITAPKERKQLFLSLREPLNDASVSLTKSYDKDLDALLLKIKQAQDYFLLVGPPGTGKTHKATKYIVQEELQKENSNILLLSYTNRAVDELCSMLTEDLGVDFLRLGRSYSCDSQYKRFLLNSALDKESPKLENLRNKISQTRIFVSTVSYLLSRPNIFLLKQFSLALIDEASQILEPDLIGILCSHMKQNDKCDIDKFVMVGDYKQLPAIVLQTIDESKVENELLLKSGFSNSRMSLFQRLIYNEKTNNRDSFTGTLKKQGRMHPEIAEFPNKMFYANDKLEIVPCEHQKEDHLGYDSDFASDALGQILAQNRLVFFNSPQNISPQLSDKVNVYEADLIADITLKLALLNSSSFNEKTTIGIIVPYRNQISLIRKEIEKRKKECKEDLPNLDNITIDTVERFQGSQRDVIIFSFTIQHLYQLDFLTANNFVESFDNGAHIIDPKLNVVMTRARKQLIMVGNESILRNNSVYQSMMSYVKDNGCYIDNFDVCQ